MSICPTKKIAMDTSQKIAKNKQKWAVGVQKTVVSGIFFGLVGAWLSSGLTKKSTKKVWKIVFSKLTNLQLNSIVNFAYYIYHNITLQRLHLNPPLGHPINSLYNNPICNPEYPKTIFFSLLIIPLVKTYYPLKTHLNRIATTFH